MEARFSNMKNTKANGINKLFSCLRGQHHPYSSRKQPWFPLQDAQERMMFEAKRNASLR